MTDEIQDAAGSVNAFAIRLIVLLCGAALMGLEMAGVRIVEPFFGSTIYVWGSIIGIFLGALSVGYFVGGILADRKPSMELLGFIILASALLMFIIPPISGPVCKALSGAESVGPRLRAVIGSVILYALPSILLGMVSPFAVRLAARQVKQMGSVAGSLYATSTLGSIIGTFMVSFVLTELIGSRMIVFGIGVMLILVSGICFYEKRRLGMAAAVVAILLAIPAFMSASVVKAPQIYSDQKVLDHAESAYHTIHVIEAESYLVRGKRARYMIFNDQIESGVLLDADGKLPKGGVRTACGYTRMVHLGLVMMNRLPRNVLVIGCGGGIIPQDFINDYGSAVERIDVVDIDDRVFEFANKYFGYPANGANPVIHSHVEDGRLFMARSKIKWDYILLDAYTAGGRIPRHLISQQFFQIAKSKLAPDGVLIANVISATKGSKGRLYRSCYKTMDSVFPGRIYAFPRHHSGDRAENIMLVAAPDGARLNSGDVWSRYQKMASRIKQEDVAQMVRSVLVTAPEMEADPLLTDDFCPTDSMVYD